MDARRAGLLHPWEDCPPWGAEPGAGGGRWAEAHGPRQAGPCKHTTDSGQAEFLHTAVIFSTVFMGFEIIGYI